MKVALISDIHFGKFSRTEELSVPGFQIEDENTGAESLVDGFIKLLKKEKADFILIAGDLTSIASPLEFHYFEEEILHIAHDAGIPIENVICVTGNHDNDWNISKLSISSITENMGDSHIEILKTQYQKIAANSASMNMTSFNNMQNGIAPFSGVFEREDMILFAINTGWFCSPTQEYAHGKLSAEQLTWLEKELIRFQADSRTKIFLLHHHPIKYSYPSLSEDISLIEESSELLDLAGKYGVNLILHGHRHHPRAQTIQHDDWSKPISFVCAGSLSVNAKHRSNGEIPNTAHFIDFSEAPSAFLLRTYEYSGSTGWQLLTRNRPEAPLDAEVWLGKIYQDEDVLSAIRDCLSRLDNQVTVFQYADLPDCLRFRKHDEINRLFQENVPQNYIINGLFPGRVTVIPEEAIRNADS